MHPRLHGVCLLFRCSMTASSKRTKARWNCRGCGFKLPPLCDLTLKILRGAWKLLRQKAQSQPTFTLKHAESEGKANEKTRTSLLRVEEDLDHDLSPPIVRDESEQYLNSWTTSKFDPNETSNATGTPRLTSRTQKQATLYKLFIVDLHG